MDGNMRIHRESTIKVYTAILRPAMTFHSYPFKETLPGVIKRQIEEGKKNTSSALRLGHKQVPPSGNKERIPGALKLMDFYAEDPLQFVFTSSGDLFL